MDAPLGPSAMRRSEDGPAYDLISLGLVVFTILLLGIWTSRFFHESATYGVDFNRVTSRFESDPVTGNLTAAGNLSAAKWADFNLRSLGGGEISQEFQEHLKQALEQEEDSRKELERRKGLKDDQTKNEAAADLSENYVNGKGPARLYLDEWLAGHIAWLDAGDHDKVNKTGHMNLARFLVDLDMREQAVDELEKAFKSSSDLENRARTNPENVLVDEFKYRKETAAELSEIIQVRQHHSGTR